MIIHKNEIIQKLIYIFEIHDQSYERGERTISVSAIQKLI
jgi:hypothetical protein